MSEENSIDNQLHSNAPKWFSIVAIILLIWNLLGVMAFIMQMMMTPEDIAALPQAEQELYANVPTWAIVAFACAVFGGALGCLLLVLKKSSALYLLVLSVLGVCVQMYHSFFISNSIEVYGPGGMIMPVMVIVIAFALVWLCRKATAEKWIS